MANKLERLVSVHERVNQLIYLEYTNQRDQNKTQEPILVENVLIVARRLSSACHSPPFIRFNPDTGPLEALPPRFRFPFPSVEDMRFSILNIKQATSVPVNLLPPKPKEDEYEDDF